MKKQFGMTFLLSSLFLLTGCTSSNLTLQNEDTELATLYGLLGGKSGVDKLTENFIEILHADPRLAELFAEIDDEDTMRNLSDFLCQLTDGGCEYQGVDLYDMHVGMEISKAEFDHFVSLFIDAMENTQIAFSTQNKLLTRLAKLRPEIIDLQSNE